MIADIAPPVKRTSDDIQKDFNNLAFKCGHLQHATYKQTKDLEVMNQTLLTLQKEYSDAKTSEDAAAAEAAKAVAAVVPAPEAAPASGAV